MGCFIVLVFVRLCSGQNERLLLPPPLFFLLIYKLWFLLFGMGEDGMGEVIGFFFQSFSFFCC